MNALLCRGLIPDTFPQGAKWCWNKAGFGGQRCQRAPLWASQACVVEVSG